MVRRSLVQIQQQHGRHNSGAFFILLRNIVAYQARVVLRRVHVDLARDVFPSYPGAALVESHL